MKVNLKEAYVKGQQVAEDSYEVGEQGKAGVYRGGNAGAVVKGAPTGSCPRLVHLRTNKQWQPPKEESDYQDDGIDGREIMFGKGRFNEDFNHAMCEAGLPDNLQLHREGVLKIDETYDSFRMTGTPDGVIVDRETQEPLHLIEHKAVCGTGMATGLLQGKGGKLAHILQAGNYMHHLGVDEGSLIYTSSDYRKIPYYEQSKMPAPGAKHSDKIAYYYKEAYLTASKLSKKGWSAKTVDKERWDKIQLDSFRDKKNEIVPAAQHEVQNILPFQIWFDLRWENGTLQWVEHGSSNWFDTEITIEDILALYEMAETMKGGELVPRPIAYTASMTADKYSACGLCPLNEVCNYTEKNKIETTDEWEKLVFNYYGEK